MATKTALRTRAVVRTIEPGSEAICEGCGDRVKFSAKTRAQQVICNVYVRDRWDRVEHYHFECYEGAGRPHGTAA